MSIFYSSTLFPNPFFTDKNGNKSHRVNPLNTKDRNVVRDYLTFMITTFPLKYGPLSYTQSDLGFDDHGGSGNPDLVPRFFIDMTDFIDW